METSQSFNKRLRQKQEQTGSLLCVGIDPDLERLPAPLPKDAGGVNEFCSAIIQATAGHVCAYKFNSAFFEVLGSEGFEVLRLVRNQVPPEIICIYDVKRGDIGNTAKHYARAAFETFHMDAVTVNPYMGSDAVAPFIESPVHGAFVLCFTSNPGSGDFQRQKLASGNPLYQAIAAKADEWNTSDNIGLVVGATQAEAISGIREYAPTLPLLTPGIGPQGGDLSGVLSAGLTAEGGGLIIPVSRAVLYAGSGSDFASQAGIAAAQMKEKINKSRKR